MVLSGMPAQPGIGETVINNYYNSPAPDAPDTQQADWSNDPGVVQADDSQAAGDKDYAADQDYGADQGQDFGSDPGGGVDI